MDLLTKAHTGLLIVLLAVWFTAGLINRNGVALIKGYSVLIRLLRARGFTVEIIDKPLVSTTFVLILTLAPFLLLYNLKIYL